MAKTTPRRRGPSRPTIVPEPPAPKPPRRPPTVAAHVQEGREKWLASVRGAAEFLRQAEAHVALAEADIRLTAAAAASAGVPKSLIAEAAGVSRPTLYGWLGDK